MLDSRIELTKERKVIDSLKGIAILGIILVHSGCRLPGILGGVAKACKCS